MAAATVVVAIPAVDDYVNKISSEKVAHLTLLILDELNADDAQHITEYLEHAATTSLSRFGLPVERRGGLGAEDADVLFFDKEFGFLDRLVQFRSHLLKDPVVKRAWDSVEQYPEWTPHLTLGYPGTPAHEDTRDYPGTSWVNFDRIALWTGDYEGFEVPLTSNERMSVAMGEDPVDAFLAHYGVKGMQWGVRRKSSGGSSGGSSAPPAKSAPKKNSVPEGKPAIGKGGRITSAPTPKGAPKKAHEMSDDELRKVIARIDMEKRYNQISAPPPAKPTKTQAATKFVADLLLDVGKQQVKTVLVSVATAQVNKQLESRGLPTAPKKKKDK